MHVCCVVFNSTVGTCCCEELSPRPFWAAIASREDPSAHCGLVNSMSSVHSTSVVSVCCCELHLKCFRHDHVGCAQIVFSLLHALPLSFCCCRCLSGWLPSQQKLLSTTPAQSPAASMWRCCTTLCAACHPLLLWSVALPLPLTVTNAGTLPSASRWLNQGFCNSCQHCSQPQPARLRRWHSLRQHVFSQLPARRL